MTSRNFAGSNRQKPRALERAENLLVDLGALSTREATISALGRRMLAFPVHPRYARMLLAAREHNCVRAIALIAAVTQGRGLLRRAEGKQARDDRDDLLGSDDDSDLFVLTRAFRFAEKNNFDPVRCARLSVNASAAREAAQLWEQFIAIARDEGLDVETREAESGAIQRCVLAGFPDQVAVRLDQGTLRCALVHGRRAVLARESVVHRAPLLVASEIREIESSDKERQVLLTLATRIEEPWLRDLFPEAFSEAVEVSFDAASRRVVARSQTTFHDLVLRNGPADAPPEQAAALLARQVVAGTCPLKHWDNAVEQWIARVNCAVAWFPELQIPPIGEADKLLLIEQICSGALSYKEIKDRAVWPVVKSWLPPHQQQLIEQLAPERIELPNGRKAKITYSDNSRRRSPRESRTFMGSIAISPSAARACRLSSKCWPRTTARSRSLPIWRGFGATPTQKSKKNCSANTQSTSGVETTVAGLKQALARAATALGTVPASTGRQTLQLLP